MNQKKHLQLLLLMTVFWCLIPTVTNMNGESNELLWFVYLYCLAGYIRRYGFWLSIKPAACLILAVAGLLFTFGTTYLWDTSGTRYTNLAAYVLNFLGMQELPILLVSILLFQAFAQMNLRHISWVNKLATATFGVYLIHDIPFMRDLLWKMLLHNAEHANSALLIPYSFLVIGGVYLFCAAIELCRIATVEKLYLPFLSRISERITQFGV